MIGGKQKGNNHNRSHQQGRNFTTAHHAEATAQRIRPRKCQRGCIAAVLPTGKPSRQSVGPSRQDGTTRPAPANCDTVHHPGTPSSRPPQTPPNVVFWWQFPNGSPLIPPYTLFRSPSFVKFRINILIALRLVF